MGVHMDRCIPHKAGIQSGWGRKMFRKIFAEKGCDDVPKREDEM